MRELFGVTPRTGGAPSSEYLRSLTPIFEQSLRDLERDGISTVHDVSEGDVEVLEHLFLYDVYQRFVDDFDDLIERQLAERSRSIPVPFARDAIAALLDRGLTEAAAIAYFALSFQLRRAYSLIERSSSGQSPCMRTLRQALWKNVFTHDVRLFASHMWERMEDFSLLLVGETGTGKGTAAAAIGHSGHIAFDGRRGAFEQPFTATYLATNLSEFSESLIESELFGHRKGAFTGAVSDHAGLLERCGAHGTLFFDEIGDVSVSVHWKNCARAGSSATTSTID